MIDSNALRRAWSRDGAAADDRPEEVDEIMADRETVGYEEGLPLLSCKYDDYMTGDSLLRPAARDALETLAEHDLVADVEDMAHELHSPTETVKKALELHGIEEPSGFDVSLDTDRLHALVDCPDRMKNPDNPLVVATLYVEKGLSVSEVRDVLDEGADDNTAVTERAVKQTLVDARVIDGQTSEQRERQWKQSRGDVTQGSRGRTINSEDY